MADDTPVALVTGAGTGIGAACARALAEEGFRVAVHYRSSEAAAREIADKLPDAFTVCADITDSEQTDALMVELKEKAGRVDVLVNNAGYNRNAPLPAMKLEDYDAVAAVQRGTWYLTKVILRRFMLRQKTGRIVNITSVVGHTGNRGQTVYTMVKAGLDAMTKSLAQELAGRAILVNSVAPGFIDTEMTEQLPDEIRQGILDKIPQGRMGSPEEVADAVAWLATRASYVNGTVLHVNGGMYGGVGFSYIPELLERIPQKEPFRFVETLHEIREDFVRGGHTWNPEADFYRGHFPGNPVTPGVLLVESMAQCGVVLLSLYLTYLEHDDDEAAKFQTIFTEANVEFSGMVRPGDRVTTETKRLYWRRRKLKAEVEMKLDDGTVICSGQLAGIGVPT